MIHRGNMIMLRDVCEHEQLESHMLCEPGEPGHVHKYRCWSSMCSGGIVTLPAPEEAA